MILPYEPESWESIRFRLWKALETVTDLEQAEQLIAARATQTGENRDHVFDLEDGRRVMVSRVRTRGRIWLHVSIGMCRPTLNKAEFFSRAEMIGGQLWPDKTLRMVDYMMTDRALHIFYEPPKGFKP